MTERGEEKITEHRWLTKILFHDIKWYFNFYVEESIRGFLKIYSYVFLNIIKPVLQEKLYSLVSIIKSNTLSAAMPVQSVFKNQN